MMDINEIMVKQNYLHPSRYISGRIVEYDIKSANISTLRMQNIISEEDYIRLSNMPKMNREIEIGLMIKNDKEIYNYIQKGIKSAKLALAKANNIEVDSICRIANDAVYINSVSNLQRTKFGQYIEFKQKSEFNIMVTILNVIIFCKFMNNGDIDIDVKGIGDNVSLHQEYMINAIASTIVILERSGVIEAINCLSRLCEQYVSLQLPVGYYRTFNSDSVYVTRYNNTYYLYDTGFGIKDCTQNDVQSLDINYNYSILRELWSILIDIYNIRRY